MNKENRQGPFCKKGYKGWGFLIKMEEGEGLKGKIVLHPLPLDAEQERGAGRRRWPSPAAQGTAAAGIRGKRERGPREIESPP